mgnify:CR=1 FL=1
MEENKEEFTYEEEQLQQILLQELHQKMVEEQRKLKQKQDEEYKESLQKDIDRLDDQKVTFDEPSIEEMRRVRILRFSGVKD